MSKNKHKPVEAVEEVREEHIEETPETESVACPEPKQSTHVERTLKAINKMENSAKAERLANRLLRKRKG